MRRLTIIFAIILATTALTVAPGSAMEPPGEPAQQHFGCVGGENAAVAGHPGAAGLVDAAPRVGQLTDDPLPTAWNAVEHAEPIEFGSC